jgi:hypothetical protein
MENEVISNATSNSSPQVVRHKIEHGEDISTSTLKSFFTTLDIKLSTKKTLIVQLRKV